MMVNDLKNNITLPWQSTIPEQMPWMRPYEQSPHESIQFGRQHHDQQQQNQRIPPNKRSSVEMDDIISDDIDEPPTKQLLSEQKLFKKFGSLQIDGHNTRHNNPDSNSDDDDSDSSNDDNQPKTYTSMTDSEKEDLNRYVYILFKDKKNDDYLRAGSSGSSHFKHLHCNTALDRLAREERDKLNKAVVLWNPRINIFKLTNQNDTDSDSDEEFTYKDHRDFLKKRDDDSIIITDVTYDHESLSAPSQSSDDQLMLD